MKHEKKNCFQHCISTNQYMISKGSDSEDWSNDAENSAFLQQEKMTF